MRHQLKSFCCIFLIQKCVNDGILIYHCFISFKTTLMIKKICYAVILTVTVLDLSAQDKDVQKIKNETKRQIKKDEKQAEGWTKGGVFGLNLSQGSSRNWAAGAEKFSFSLNGLFNTHAYLKRERNAWDNTVNMQYGVVNTTSQGTRKNDDRFDLLSRYGYQLKNPKWYVAVLGNLRSQFTDGFAYEANNVKIKNSSLFAPAYALLSPGIMYKPNATFDAFISPVTSRWVIVNGQNKELRRLFGFTDTTKSTFNEIGAFATANLKKDLAKNINLVSRLDLFSNYKRDPQNIDIYCTNLLGMKVNKYLGVTIGFDLVYDHDAKDPKVPGKLLGTQWKSLIGVGFSANF